LCGADDPTLLARAARNQRVEITQEVTTIAAFAYKRGPEGKPMAGAFEVSRRVPPSLAIEEEQQH
jgi:hypothetical protein